MQVKVNSNVHYGKHTYFIFYRKRIIMKTRDEIKQELDRMIQRHYYAEDYELEWEAHRVYKTYAPEEQQRMVSVLIERLTSDPCLATVTVCKRIPVPELAPILAVALDREQRATSQSRAILATLLRADHPAAYDSVERFVESEQEGEALACLARWDFGRTIPHLRRAMEREDLHNYCLHILRDRAVTAGLDTLKRDLNHLMGMDPDRWKPHVRKILTSAQGNYNPFPEQELKELLASL